MILVGFCVRKTVFRADKRSLYEITLFKLFDMDKKKISERIKTARDKTGMSQVDISLKMGIGTTTYKNFEDGNINYVSDHFEEFEKVTGVSAEELLIGIRPEAFSDDLLNDYESVKEKFKVMADDYERRLEDKEAIIRNQKESIELLQRQNGVLESIITKLSKND